MAFENVLFEVDAPLALITVNRPKRLNALNAQTVVELHAAAEQAAADPAVRVVILTGAGDKAFVAGADIAEMCALSALQALQFAEAGHRLGELLEGMEKPVIAAINGYALGGGCELAMACDFALASDKASIGQPEVNLGIIPGFGGTQRLLRRVPIGVARELIYSGRSLAADEALRIGLVNAVHPADQLLAKAKELGRLIASKGPLAVARCKRLMTTGLGLPLSAANELERQTFAALFSSADQKEGMNAFLEKRAPSFQGK
jgi:enoyl-CoA hydratase